MQVETFWQFVLVPELDVPDVPPDEVVPDVPPEELVVPPEELVVPPEELVVLVPLHAAEPARDVMAKARRVVLRVVMVPRILGWLVRPP